MDDDRRRKRIPLQQSIHSLPGDLTGAMTPAKPFPPEPDDTSPESVQRIRVACDPVVREVTTKLLTQCLVLFGQCAVSIRSTPLREGRQSATVTALGCLALHHPVTLARETPVVREPQQVK